MEHRNVKRESSDADDRPSDLRLKLEWSQRDRIIFFFNQFSKLLHSSESMPIEKVNNELILLLSDLPIKADDSSDYSPKKVKCERRSGEQSTELSFEISHEFRMAIVGHLILNENHLKRRWKTKQPIQSHVIDSLFERNNKLIHDLQDLDLKKICIDKEKCDVKPFKVKDELIELSDEDDIRTDNAINRTDADSSLNIDSNNQTNSDVRSSDDTLPKQQQPLNNSQCSTDDGSINSKEPTNGTTSSTTLNNGLNSINLPNTSEVLESSNPGLSTTKDNRIDLNGIHKLPNNNTTTFNLNNQRQVNAQTSPSSSNRSSFNRTNVSGIDFTNSRNSTNKFTKMDAIGRSMSDSYTSQPHTVQNEEKNKFDFVVVLHDLKNIFNRTTRVFTPNKIKIPNYPDLEFKISYQVNTFHDNKADSLLDKYLDFYIHSYSDHYECQTKFELTLLSQSPERPNQVRRFEHAFRRKDSHGCKNLISYEFIPDLELYYSKYQNVYIRVVFTVENIKKI